jgi:N-ethylmaleimide reductase
MKLYYSAGACSLTPHIVLKEAGLDFEAISAPTQTHQLPDGSDYYQLNPLGYVPLLVLDDGRQLRECAAIIQYIADLAPDKHLAPAHGTFERYKLQEWLSFISTELHKSFTPLFNAAMPGEAKALIKTTLTERFEWVDSALANAPYLMGDSFSVADAYLFNVSNWCKLVAVDITQLPHLSAFRARVRARPAVQAAMRAEGLIKNPAPKATPSLFDPCHVGRMQLANRVVMAPLTRNRAPGALPTALMATYYTQRANPVTGAGLIVSEATAISHQGQGYSDVPGIWRDDQVKAWRTITDSVHAAGGKMVMQLWHVGRVSHVDLQPNGQAPVAPSAIQAKTKTVLIKNGVPSFEDTSMPRALRLDELPGIVNDYRHAAKNAIAAGFDGVEVHGANGYLLDQFLRSGSNTRTDAYGGSLENRARLLLEVMSAVTQEIGADRVGLRLSPVTPANDAQDTAPQPLFNYVVQQLAPLGLAFLHIIEGATGGDRHFQQGDTPFDYAGLRTNYREAGGQGAWMVNNGLDAPLATEALQSGADLVAFGRLFIANPDLSRRLREGAALNKPDRATFYGGQEQGYTDYPFLT